MNRLSLAAHLRIARNNVNSFLYQPALFRVRDLVTICGLFEGKYSLVEILAMALGYHPKFAASNNWFVEGSRVGLPSTLPTLEDRLYNSNEVAEILNTSVPYIYHLLKVGKLKAERIMIGKKPQYRFTRTSVEAVRAERQYRMTAFV